MSYGEKNNKSLSPYCLYCQEDYKTIEEAMDCPCEEKWRNVLFAEKK